MRSSSFASLLLRCVQAPAFGLFWLLWWWYQKMRSTLRLQRKEVSSFTLRIKAILVISRTISVSGRCSSCVDTVAEFWEPAEETNNRERWRGALLGRYFTITSNYLLSYFESCSMFPWNPETWLTEGRFRITRVYCFTFWRQVLNFKNQRLVATIHGFADNDTFPYTTTQLRSDQKNNLDKSKKRGKVRPIAASDEHHEEPRRTDSQVFFQS